MRRNFVAGLLLVLLTAPLAQAQEWARKMFSGTSHDFGVVARGAKTAHRFKFKNLYEEDVHVSGVRSSCGCTTPQIVKPDLKTFQSGEIVAEFNTRSFLGNKSATITVTFDKPYPAEVQLTVRGTIRGDVVLSPGEIDFGTVDRGTSPEQRVSLVHAGRNDWKIVDARSANENLEVELTETARGKGKVSYDMLVRLTKDAPVGYLNDQLIVVTNDPEAPEIVVTVEGRVASAITVSPSSLYMGVLRPGQKSTKQIIVRAKTPFKITDVTCDDDGFEARTTSDSRKVHVVPVVFTAGEQAGKVSRKISIETDQAGASTSLTVYALVEANEQPTLKSSDGASKVNIVSPGKETDKKPKPEDADAKDSSDIPPVKKTSNEEPDDSAKGADDAEAKPADSTTEPNDDAGPDGDEQ